MGGSAAGAAAGQEGNSLVTAAVPAADEYRDLCSRLAALERASGGAPLVCVATQEPAAAAGRYGDATGGWPWRGLSRRSLLLQGLGVHGAR